MTTEREQRLLEKEMAEAVTHVLTDKEIDDFHRVIVSLAGADYLRICRMMEALIISRERERVKQSLKKTLKKRRWCRDEHWWSLEEIEAHIDERLIANEEG